ncbi:MAG: ZIP family metal transporter [Bacteroidetes bacterium]|nr:ZIP family metal transporter [Bacteroidota bacterium]
MMQTLIEFFNGMHPLMQGLVATGFTWLVTAIGASFVFFMKDIRRGFMDTMLGFTGGVMLAASFWSLLNPAIAMAESNWSAQWAWVPVAIGFLLGAFFIFGLDQLLPHLHIHQPLEKREGVKTVWNRTVLLVLAITLHNIPEGLAVGVAFGAVAEGLPGADMAGAIALAIGIGIQDFPEGLAVAIPLRRFGMSRTKSFLWGQLSGVVEPVAGVLGVALVMVAALLLPYLLAFAAGAMIYVVVEEVIPETQRDGHTDKATLGLIFGFVLMMALDVGLG